MMGAYYVPFAWMECTHVLYKSTNLTITAEQLHGFFFISLLCHFPSFFLSFFFLLFLQTKSFADERPFRKTVLPAKTVPVYAEWIQEQYECQVRLPHEAYLVLPNALSKPAAAATATATATAAAAANLTRELEALMARQARKIPADLPAGLPPGALAGMPSAHADIARRRLEAEQRAERELDEDVGAADMGETFISYKPLKVKLGWPHPDPVVETSALASVVAPEPSYRLGLPAALIARGLLSSLQLEAILYACQRHEQLLPSGERAGFLLGDGAGVWKGRQIAGLVYENFIRGRTKAVWLSASADLSYDAQRDFNDIGASKIPVLNLGAYTYSPIAQRMPAGVVFCTYSCLISSQKSTGKSRLTQLVAYCGGNDFDGILVFDECHKV